MEHELQREATQWVPTGRAPALVASVVSSPGHALDPVARTTMEEKFDRDLTSVRVHTDRQANESARAVGADAYTIGRHIVFGPGRYQPSNERGRSLLAHELTHGLQQGLGEGGLREATTTASAPAEREADGAAASAPGAAVHVGERYSPVLARKPNDRHIKDITVSQGGQSQRVKWVWSDGAAGETVCSTGKGHCCVEDPAAPACSPAATTVSGSNLTPVGTFTVNERTNDEKHPPFWTRFIGLPRYIALHQYSPVDGTPLSHGCVRMPSAPAKEINEGSREGVTKVHVEGVPSPLCANKNLQREWAGDFDKAGSKPDGESPAERRKQQGEIDETRSELRSAFGVNERDLDKKLAAGGNPPTAASVAPLIPRCPAIKAAKAPTKKKP